MRLIPTTSGIPVFVSEYEADVLDKCSDWTGVDGLDEFEQTLVDRLVGKGLIDFKGNRYKTITPSRHWRI